MRSVNLRRMLRAALLLACSFWINAAQINPATADAVRNQCTAEAKAKLAKYKATTTQEQRDSTKGAAVALSLLVGGVFLAAKEASQTQADVDRDLLRLWERRCLSEKGLDQLPQAAAPPAVPKGDKSDRRVRSASNSSSASGAACACKEMTTCTGSWATLTCNQLKDRCRGATGKPIVWTNNGCEKLQTLVGGF
jgi:hypothetical protein